MASRKRTDRKNELLKKYGCLNRHPSRVNDELFVTHEFFDPRDLVQVKYEMLRRVRVDGDSILHAAAAFGFSRPAFYQAKESFQEGGLFALIPKKSGPRSGHKLTAEVVEFLVQLAAEDASLSPLLLAKRVEERFQRKVHPRSIERALQRQKKKDP